MANFRNPVGLPFRQQAPVPGGTTVVPPPPPDPGRRSSGLWAARAGAQLPRSKPLDTVFVPFFNSAGVAVGTFVGAAVDSVTGSYTYSFTAALIAATIDGVPYTIRRGTIIIHEILGSASNTCNFKCEGVAPVEEQTVLLTLGDDLIFAGTIQSVDQDFEEITTQLVWSVGAVDWTWSINTRLPLGAFTNQSLSTVITSLWTRYAPPGFTATGVQSGLPPITIVFDGSLTLASAISAATNLVSRCRWRLGYDKDLRVYLADTLAPPDDLTDTNTTLSRDPQLKSTRNTSQLRNRVFVQGANTTVAVDVPAGAFRVPVDDIFKLPSDSSMMVNGQVIEPAGANNPELASRAIPPAPVLSQCSDLNQGLYPATNIQIRQSFIYGDGYESITSIPSAVVAFDGLHKLCFTTPRPPDDVVTRRIYVSAVDAPAVPTWTNNDTAVLKDITNPLAESFSENFVGFVSETGTFVIKYGDTSPRFGGPAGGAWSQTAPGVYVTPDPGVQPVDGAYGFNAFAGDIIVISKSGSPAVNRTINTIPPGMTPTAASWGFHLSDVSGIGYFIPLTTGSTASDGSMTDGPGISITLGRDYGTVVPSILSLSTDVMLATFVCPFAGLFRAGASVDSFQIAGNYICQVWSKTTLPTGHYDKGNTAIAINVVDPVTKSPIPLSDVFSPTGGVAKIGNDPIDYNGISPDGLSLTGIPDSGPGSVVCNDLGPGTSAGPGDGNGCEPGNGTLVLSQPLTAPVSKGDVISIWVQRDDLASQALYGIREFKIVDSSLLTFEAAALRGDAELDLFSQPIVTVVYSTRDKKTQIGLVVRANLTNPPLVGSFLIQDVTISQIDEKPNPTGADDELNPLYQVIASSANLLTLEDLLRR